MLNVEPQWKSTRKTVNVEPSSWSIHSFPHESTISSGKVLNQGKPLSLVHCRTKYNLQVADTYVCGYRSAPVVSG
jgi:hypothetical protein